jgi:hypothetical protein
MFCLNSKSLELNGVRNQCHPNAKSFLLHQMLMAPKEITLIILMHNEDNRHRILHILYNILSAPFSSIHEHSSMVPAYNLHAFLCTFYLCNFPKGYSQFHLLHSHCRMQSLFCFMTIPYLCPSYTIPVQPDWNLHNHQNFSPEYNCTILFLALNTIYLFFPGWY